MCTDRRMTEVPVFLNQFLKLSEKQSIKKLSLRVVNRDILSTVKIFVLEESEYCN